MKTLPELLAPLPLFAGFSHQELERLERVLSLSVACAGQGEPLLRADDPAPAPGCLLSGRAQAFLTDYWGHRSILNHLRPGDLFGEAALLLSAPLPVAIWQTNKVTAILVELHKRIV